MRLEGIILKTIPYGDSDLILRLVTRTHGKVSLFARSARKSKKRFGSVPDVFDTGFFECAQGRGTLPSMRSFRPSRSFPALRTNLEKMTAASLLCECFDLLLLEDMQEDSERIFLLLYEAFVQFQEGTTIRELFRAVFSALSSLLQSGGFLAPEQAGEPSAHNLRRLLAITEQIAERPLQSKDSLLSFLHSLQKEKERDT